MKWIAVVVFMLVCAAGVQLWLLRRSHEQAVCRAVHALAVNTLPGIERWLADSGSEPYLGEAALMGEPMAVIQSFRSRARELASEGELLPPAVAAALRSVSVTGPGFALALAKYPSSLASFPCREPPAGPSPQASLDRDFAVADAVFAGRKNLVPHEKAEFARDRQIYCMGDQILARLRIVTEGAAKKCREAKPGSKLAKNCAAKNSESALEAEMKDVEAGKVLNERKLRQKWPPAVMAGLQC